MKIRSRKGFTIIEVTLFLAISAALLVGVLSGSVASIKRHRYNDSVNDFVEFLRRTYSEVVDVENERTGTIGDSWSCSITGMLDGDSALQGISDGSWTKWTNTAEITRVDDGKPGRSRCAIYGMLITFGEDDSTTIRTYDVIGQTIEKHSGLNANTEYETLNDALKAVHADIITLNVRDDSGSPLCKITPAGNAAYYNLQWDAKAEDIEGNLFKGSVLIVRSPVSGTIHTLFIKEPIGANAVIENQGEAYSVSDGSGRCATGSLRGYTKAVEENRLMKNYIDDDDTSTTEKFHTEQVDICIASDDSLDMGGRRRNVRILRDGRNATAVELVPMDDTGDNKCQN